MGAGGVPVIGGIFQAGGALAEAQDKAWALEDEAIASDKNAKIAREAGDYNAGIQEIKTTKVIGAIKADFGYSGVSADSGSVLEILRESHANAEVDRMNILYGAELKAQNFEERAKAARAGAKSAKQAGTFNAFSALFMSGAKGASYGGGGGSSSPAADSGSSGGGYGSAGNSYFDAGSTA